MTKEALTLALEALTNELACDRTNDADDDAAAEQMYDAISAIKEALAQPEQEPVTAKMDTILRRAAIRAGKVITPPQRPAEPDQEPVVIPREDSQEAANAIQATLAEYQYPANPTNAARAGWRAARLYTALQQRPWVGLTDEDKAEILNRKWWNFEDEFDLDGFLRLAEDKLKEKNT